MERAGRLFSNMDFPSQLDEAETRARAAWPRAAGKKIAKHARAVSLVRGTLVVEVGDYVWQRQLSALRHFLLRNLARDLGPALVTEIDFRPTPKRRPPQAAVTARPGARSGPGPVEGIEDPVMSLLYKRSQGNRR
jgi:predicted nucleic acid-binding Zn ribbon protein